jgi:mycothiol synthase
MKLTMRPYRNEEDYWQMRQFLREVMLLNNFHQYSWHVARLDYWWWFIQPDLEKMDLEQVMFFWETETGEVAAILNPEGKGQAYLQIHPNYRTPELEEEMIATAEKRLKHPNRDGRQQIQVFADSKDAMRQDILKRRGYQKVERPETNETIHIFMLDNEIQNVKTPEGYTIRALGHGLELLERCYASGLGFHEDDIHTARENRDDPSWYHHIQSAPLYRRDLDIVAVASDGSITSFCTVWFDDVTRTAYFEPVATVPKHQRHGLGKAVLTEGLRRLKTMGGKIATVGGYSDAANGLYFSVFGKEYDLLQPWEKLD